MGLFKEWLNYLWLYAFSFLSFNSPRQVTGTAETREEETPLKDKEQSDQISCDINPEKMALVPAGETAVKEEEIEQTMETTLSQKSMDLGDTKKLEKSAEFHGQQTSKVVEETGSSTQNVECSAKVVQESSKTVTDTRSVSSSKTTKSSSYSFEETGEYEYEVAE